MCDTIYRRLREFKLGLKGFYSSRETWRFDLAMRKVLKIYGSYLLVNCLTPSRCIYQMILNCYRSQANLLEGTVFYLCLSVYGRFLSGGLCRVCSQTVFSDSVQGVYIRGVSLFRARGVSLSREISVQGRFCPGGHCPGGLVSLTSGLI